MEREYNEGSINATARINHGSRGLPHETLSVSSLSGQLSDLLSYAFDVASRLNRIADRVSPALPVSAESADRCEPSNMVEALADTIDRLKAVVGSIDNSANRLDVGL